MVAEIFSMGTQRSLDSVILVFVLINDILSFIFALFFLLFLF